MIATVFRYYLPLVLLITNDTLHNSLGELIIFIINPEAMVNKQYILFTV